jgi:hypothetical protein
VRGGGTDLQFDGIKRKRMEEEDDDG